FRRTGIPFRLVVNDIQQPYEISCRHPLVRGLKAAARGIAPSRVTGSEGATVITFFKRKNIPAVATGWGASGCAHATDEFVRIADLERGARVLERFIRIFDAGFSSTAGK
ncbi:MAG: M20/M25/M40 family metallo-hydrolase, partial [Candidatus Omnitrophota bacterium]